MIKELKKELLNKKISLVDLDNYIESETETTTSLFDVGDCYNNKSCVYYITEDKSIVIGWEIIEEKENKLNTIVKVTDIFTL